MTQITHPVLSVLRHLHSPVYKLHLKSLHQEIVPNLRPGDHVLDVGCGSGALGRAIKDSPKCPPRVRVTGLEIFRRGDEFSAVKFYDGQKIPYPDKSFDVVILADVLHHAEDPHNLICECSRVAGRMLIVKDHKVEGFLARQRISFMDWASNVQYGIPCLYRYYTLKEWKKLVGQIGLEIEAEMDSMKIYPSVMNFFFGGRIQYMAVLRADGMNSNPRQRY
jgi:ubiquinone/menaquinone biosynthesis C-methylase UbiE